MTASLWLVSVAHNLFRNERRQIARRLQVLEQRAGELGSPDSSNSADAVEARELRVKTAFRDALGGAAKAEVSGA